MFGIGLRSCHYPYLESKPQTQIDWFEAISENYMDSEGRPLTILQSVRDNYPVALHGVGMSLAACEDLDRDYLSRLKRLIERIDPFLVSDHLCWTGSATHQLHDLLPFPFTPESLKLVKSKVNQAQDALNRQILVENVSSYLSFHSSSLSEWEFLAELAQTTGCKLLLDLNNLYVNAQNHHFDPLQFLDAIKPEMIGQVHLAGHTDTGTFLFDTHSSPICPEVWELYRCLARKCQKTVIPTLIEWDQDIPSFERVEEEAMQAKRLWFYDRIPESTPTTHVAPYQHSLEPTGVSL